MVAIVAALCVGPRTEYRSIEGVDCYDKRRDVRTFAGGVPVVAHPPCRSWSAFTKHQAKPEPGERELGFLCVEWLRKEGGVLEHPAHSGLFAAAGLPEPGTRRGDLFTLPILQAWFGCPIAKETWLCLSGVDPAALDVPYRHHDSSEGIGDAARLSRMSKHQRSHTVRLLAEWLVSVARRAAKC